MSHRSHIAQSGRIAIIACSAAWSVPRSLGISSEPVELLRLGDVPDRLRIEGRLGEVEADEVECRLVADRLLLVADDLLGHAHASEGELEPSLRSVRRVSSIDVIVSFFACV